MVAKDIRNADAKIALFRSLFSGLGNVYGTYDPNTGRAWQVKSPVTDKVIAGHLTGRRPYGVYLLTSDRIRAIAADFDRLDANLPREFVARARHYGIPAYIEASKSKGYHAWVFFELPGTNAAKARLVVRSILDEIECPHVEVFPKQDVLEQGAGRCGSFINAPLFGRLVAKGRTVFVPPNDPYKPYPNQWAFLDGVERVPESLLDDIIEANELDVVDNGNHEGQSLGIFQAPFGLPPCARRMLAEGVAEYQRVACFRLAVHLRKLGLPYDSVVGALREWARKNRPCNGKGVITYREIMAQTAAAFIKEYRGCGCEDAAIRPFCDTSCALFPKRG
ncbi:MAG: hypothetical protein NTZ09_11520 [Candidatus Hydrogenedentes bacterium]|nr:hypothetical protein [Candidatus Hydrogenedentota bacterium]